MYNLQKSKSACGRISGGKLKDKTCGNKFGYICEVSDSQQAKPQKPEKQENGRAFYVVAMVITAANDM